MIRKYEQDIAELQQELAMHDSLTERHQISYGPYTEAQKAEVAAQVQAFLQSQEAPDSIAPLQLLSLRHMKEVLFAAKVGLLSWSSVDSGCAYVRHLCPLNSHSRIYSPPSSAETSSHVCISPVKEAFTASGNPSTCSKHTSLLPETHLQTSSSSFTVC